MLDALKKMGSSGAKPARQQAAELEALIATSREERAALSAMLTQTQLQSARLAAAGKSLQDVYETAERAQVRLEGVTEGLRGDLRLAETEVRDSNERISALRAECEQLRVLAAQLTTDLAQMREVLRETHTLPRTKTTAARAKKPRSRAGSPAGEI